MNLEKNVSFTKGIPSFTVTYNEKNFEERDTSVEVYDRYKISIVLSDGIAAVCKDKVILTEAADVLFFRPDELHFGRMLRAGRHSYLDFYLPYGFFDALTYGDHLSFFLTDNGDDRINRFSPDAKAKSRILYIGDRIKDLINTPTPLSDTEIFLLLLDILVMISEGYCDEKRKTQDKGIPSCVKKALSFINKNYSEQISLGELAEECGCSVTYLSKTFKRYTGTTIYKYIVDFRIEMAKQMLAHSSVTEVSYAVGFSDTSNFIKTFREICGVTPHKYKEKR